MSSRSLPTRSSACFKANPYYFKVDSSGQQLPYIDRVHERFLNADLQVLAILNGEVDYKAQGNELENYPDAQGRTRRRAASPCCCRAGSIGTDFAFNITHADPKLRAVYGDLRFRQAVSLRHQPRGDEPGPVFRPRQAQPGAAGRPDVLHSPSDANYMIDYDVDKANALLDEMGMKQRRRRHAHLPGRLALHDPLGIFEPVRDAGIRQADDRLPQGGRAQRQRQGDHLRGDARQRQGRPSPTSTWNGTCPYEPTLVANIDLYVPYYSDISPLFGVKWRQWYDTTGAKGEEPPDWAKQMFDIAREWKTVLPGSDRYTELGKELVKLNLENMTLIGTIGALPKPVAVERPAAQREGGHEDGPLQLRLQLSLPPGPVVQGLSFRTCAGATTRAPASSTPSSRLLHRARR